MEGTLVSDDQIMRLVGTLEAQAKSFEVAITVMNSDLKALRHEVAHLNEQLAAIQGGRKALWGLLAGAGILGGLLTSLVAPLFEGLFPHSH